MIRPAVPDDLDALCSLGERFTEQSDLPLTYDYELARAQIWGYIYQQDAILLVADHNGVIAGAALGMVEREFCKEPMGYLNKFFIEAEFRGLGVSRDLLEAFDKEAKIRGAAVVFASATAGMGERVEKLYVRLFEKNGYKVLGRVLVKEV